MAGLPKNFEALSNVLANYDFVDIASGTGYITFYAGSTVDLKLLSNNAYYSQSVYTPATQMVNGANTKVLDIDFDIILNRPLDLRGLGIVNLPFYMSSGGNTTFWNFILKVRKWDGAVETDICTNNSVDYSLGGFNVYYETATDLTIPLTHFKKGETLRLTVEVWGYTTGAAVGDLRLGHDPKSRTTGWDVTGAVPSQLVFQCPVRLNL